MEKNKVEEREKVNRDKEEIHTKKKFTIFGISIWRILAYFIIYSIAGYIIETIFGLLTKGVIESRKSFLYGPFCAIYGVGAVVMIVSLQYFKKNNYTLFFGGFVVGSIVEYLVSLIGEFIFHVKWWDYSNELFNINGRICVMFSLFWGVLAIYLMSHFNMKVDKLIDKIKEKVSSKILNSAVIIIVIFMFLDCVITGAALKMFFADLVHDYNLPVQNSEIYLKQYEEKENDEIQKKLRKKYFTNEKMIKTFPNLKIISKNGEIIFIRDVLKDIQPYYFKVFDKKI